jgi:COMPASS component SWD2
VNPKEHKMSKVNNGSTLTVDLFSKFQIAKVFANTNNNSIDFDNTGSFLLCSSDDEALRIYDAKLGTLKNTAFSKKYGCNLARFTHKPTAIVYASTKEDDAIRYLSIYDNKYLRYFKGHTGKVTSLKMSPQDDTFLSASLDETVRLWDLRTPNCQGLMSTVSGMGPSVVGFDQTGLVFGVGMQSNYLRLYDLKNYENGPFASFDLNQLLKTVNDPTTNEYTSYTPQWSDIKFSNDGNNILINTKMDIIYLIDAFNGNVKHMIKGRVNQSGLDLDANFTPCGKYIYSGSQDGSIFFWEVETGNKITSLEGHFKASTSVAWNPRYMMFASSDADLVKLYKLTLGILVSNTLNLISFIF